MYKLLMLGILTILIGCAAPNYQGFTLSSDPVPTTHEYIGDVVVVKEGYYFLWFIPFATNKEEWAKEMMVEKTRWGFPEANDIYEVETSLKEDVELFDWTPRVILKGKIVKRR